MAAIVAARVYNDRAGKSGAVFGAVTTGDVWRFLRLDGDVAAIDRPEYYLPQVPKLLGIFRHIGG